jgi:hypothetical protein
MNETHNEFFYVYEFRTNVNSYNLLQRLCVSVEWKYKMAKLIKNFDIARIY